MVRFRVTHGASSESAPCSTGRHRRKSACPPVTSEILPMDPRTAPNKRLNRCVRVEATPDATAALMQSDPAKVEVMGLFRELVAHGFAEWQTLDDGTIRLRLITGETYLLEPATVTRIA